MLKGSFVRREETSVVDRLERRLGRLHARQRLGIEADHEAQIFGQGLNFFHIENWYSIHSLIRAAFVVPIRLNCLPEITLHRLHSAVLQ